MYSNSVNWYWKKKKQHARYLLYITHKLLKLLLGADSRFKANSRFHFTTWIFQRSMKRKRNFTIVIIASLYTSSQSSSRPSLFGTLVCVEILALQRFVRPSLDRSCLGSVQPRIRRTHLKIKSKRWRSKVRQRGIPRGSTGSNYFFITRWKILNCARIN